MNYDDIIMISAKDGIGIKKVLDVIINRIPCPKTNENCGTRALIFDSTYDQFRGVVPYVRIIDGFLEKGMSTKYFAYFLYFENDVTRAQNPLPQYKYRAKSRIYQ